jgi:hypothetical protein
MKMPTWLPVLLAYAAGALVVAALWALAPRHAPDAQVHAVVKEQPQFDPECHITGTSEGAIVTLEHMTCSYRDGHIVEVALN